VLFFRNVWIYRTPGVVDGRLPRISVLIPARNEEQNIRQAVESATASTGVELEVVVLDDHSSDRTAAEVRSIAARDGRVRLHSAPPLPAGWCGKQHACHVLSKLATSPVLCFIDADVRLAPDALVRMAGYLENSGAALISGFPQEKTGSWFEHLLIPLIHFVLLGFLPIDWMRRGTMPAYAAGCGQLMVVRRGAYEASGGHAAIRGSLHDGLNLPKVFRRTGLRTDLFDATSLATCRMYSTAREVWTGLAKNATEGLGAPSRILPFTLILLAGQVLPFALLSNGFVPVMAAACALAPRIAACLIFRQPLLGALLHPLGILGLLSIQWYALICRLARRPASWKGREYHGPSVVPVR
jgi:hypothetical protein